MRSSRRGRALSRLLRRARGRRGGVGDPTPGARPFAAGRRWANLVGEVQSGAMKTEKLHLGPRASGPSLPISIPPRLARGWHTRGYHPHFDSSHTIQSITFRLHDSVPSELIERWRAELHLEDHQEPTSPRCAELRDRISYYEDAGHGACHLKDPRIAELVENAFLHFDGERYRLLEWCVMPNHVHVLLETCPGRPQGDIIRSWNTFTARKANCILGRKGAFWMADYYDRFIRDAKHLETVRRYIRENPVKAGLCREAEDWRWSSAFRKGNGGEGG